MFQPMPTPYAAPYSSFGAYAANAQIPEYSFAPTPLGQSFGASNSCSSSSHGVSNNGDNSGSGGTANLNVQVHVNNNHLINHHHHPGLAPNPADPVTSPLLQQLPPLPLRQHNDHHNHHNHHHRLSPSTNKASSPAVAAAAAAHHHRLHNSRPRHQINRSNKNRQQLRNHGHQHIKMEQQSDVTDQELAASKYKPSLEGPYVGEKTPSHAITEEYAKADPTFVAKTLGDGNCGWRAIGFGYLESLVRCGVNQLQSELARLRTLNDYLETAGGFDPMVTEDFTDITFELMTELIQALAGGADPMKLLMEKFNDGMASAAMIYHLRLLAASWLKGNFAEYEAFIPGDVNSYCDEWILPVDREIDHLGMVLLFKVLLKPANMVLEIAYLDRSEGDQVNVHRMPDEANGKDAASVEPMIQLLYRPGHYDILYRTGGTAMQTPPIPSGPTSLQVNRVTSLSHQHDIRQSSVSSLQDYATLDMTALSMIPAMGPPSISPLGSPPADCSPVADAYTPPPMSPWVTSPYSVSDGLPPTQLLPQQQSSPPQQEAPLISPLNSLRFSKYNYPLPGLGERASPGSSTTLSEPTFTTSMFKNSHFNTAHYNNPHFQPEEYKPENDEDLQPASSNSSRNGGRKRSH
ncbi:peptidase C65 Otubain-domain-containing protein [Apiospora kogelbergensis]|uniref:peptidase C65 Otubain-domain-containing protein n=1 Tax=Apiospora kogelbergensis TaxID=1337665 RepID=UPI00312FDD3B